MCMKCHSFLVRMFGPSPQGHLAMELEWERLRPMRIWSIALKTLAVALKILMEGIALSHAPALYWATLWCHALLAGERPVWVSEEELELVIVQLGSDALGGRHFSEGADDRQDWV